MRYFRYRLVHFQFRVFFLLRLHVAVCVYVCDIDRPLWNLNIDLSKLTTSSKLQVALADSSLKHR